MPHTIPHIPFNSECYLLQELILRVGYIPTQGIMVTHLTIDKDFAYGGLVIPIPDDGITPPQGVTFIARQIDQKWQVALSGTPEFEALMQGIVLSPQAQQYLGIYSTAVSTKSAPP